MAKQVKKRFWSGIDEDDEVTGGGIPDEDGMIYLNKRRRTKAAKAGNETKKAKKPSGRSRGKD
jgi:hypothetical protein